MEKYFLDFDLPEEYIATQPSQERDGDRMMVLENQQIIHDSFTNISSYLRAGDLIVFNNSKVFKARLDIMSAKSGMVSEMLLIEQENDSHWTAMIKKARRFKKGDAIVLNNGVTAVIIDILEDGLRRIAFEHSFYPEDAELCGLIPLPPYIIDERKRRGQELYTSDDEIRYQTLFAKHYGSVAAPTASLRFSEKILSELSIVGVQFAEVTLHVGIGTFKPMDIDPDSFQIHRERISVSQETIDKCRFAKESGHRVIAAGTTVCRALESANGQAFDGWTDIFIKPGYKFHTIDGLITNFHLPHSTLLLLVQAFAGVSNTKNAYDLALENHYRFFSYGDGMLLL